MRFTTDELTGPLNATLIGPAVRATGVAIDSRGLVGGELFVALRAERDGHQFVPVAAAAGAVAVVVDHPVDVTGGHDVAQLVVADTAVALERLGAVARRRLPDRVVGITGSVGKTTTKDLLAAVLGQREVIAASEKSFNNELGVPLTLANAPDAATAAVVEMGARGIGHIAYLCGIASPTVGVVTAVEAVHTEVMGGIEDIAVAKSELVAALPAHGHAILNADNPYVAAMSQVTDAQVLTFGEAGHVRATNVTVDDDLRASFVLNSPWGSAQVSLGARGVHNVANALAAAAAALVLDVPLDAVVSGLAAAPASPLRMDLRRCASGAVVLNDSYNAGPASMAAALRSLAALPAEQRIAVVGIMAELGERGPDEHRQVAALAASLGVRLVPVATDLYGVEPVPDIAAAVAAVGPLGVGTAVLVKGSRVAGLERVADALIAEAGGSVPD
ncbi:MAG: UDP-N-acetylmuramoyl-tripeptide--D-alanyl-D-alanine ligase [Actinomycetes bacterium]